MWNSREPQIRQAVDYMKWSRIKLECVWELCKKDVTMNFASYVLPILRYHDRWKELGKEDYSSEFLESLKDYRGYKLVTDRIGETEYNTLDMDHLASIEEKEVLLTEYVDGIVELCRESDIELIFIRTPYEGTSEAEYLQIKKYAEKNNIDYYDLNLEKLYGMIAYGICNDNVDGSHANFRGATKMTLFIGEIIETEYWE